MPLPDYDDYLAMMVMMVVAMAMLVVPLMHCKNLDRPDRRFRLGRKKIQGKRQQQNNGKIFHGCNNPILFFGWLDVNPRDVPPPDGTCPRNSSFSANCLWRGCKRRKKTTRLTLGLSCWQTIW
jgi:hypothetical protein